MEGKTLTVTSHGYAAVVTYHGKVEGRYKYTREYLHRVIMQPGPGLEVDHINGDRLDNRRLNLRVCTRSSNAKNTSTKVGYKGVHKNHRGKWIAQITKNYNCHHLGTFRTAEEAAIAYNDAASILHGEFARLNIV